MIGGVKAFGASIHGVFGILLLVGISVGLGGCSSVPKGSFDQSFRPGAPDYSKPEAWAALPTLEDEADHFPKGYPNRQDEAAVDIFFLHPTIYTGKKGDTLWNGPVDDPALNARVDGSSIRYQASLFNQAGRIYAPRYRQAHINAYYSEQRADAKKAFELAYEDVRRAFQYYLEHYNQGRPIIIAAHSQGAQHGRQLLAEFFDGKPLQKQLVVAYLVGMPVSKTLYTNLTPCATPEETGCYCSWRTFLKGHGPRITPPDQQIAVTNPLNWLADSTYAPKSLHKGAVLKNFNKIYPSVSDAQNTNNLLWISKPKFPGSFLYWRSNYHIGDFNLFYINVRENSVLRAETFLKSR